MVLVQKELKNAYIGEVLECDFTKSDCWFVYNSWSTTSYWRNSNWLYVTSTSDQRWVSRTVPSSIYSKWNPKKIVFTFNWGAAKNGWWLWTWFDTKRMRHYTWFRVLWWTQNQSWTAENSPANTDWLFTADLENKLISSSLSSSTMSLTDNAVSAFYSDWSAGNVTVHVIAYTNNTYAYIKNITFYF